MEVAKRIKKEAARSHRSLGDTVADHLQRSQDGQRYKEANQEVLQRLEPLRGTGVRAAILEEIIEVLQKPIFPDQRFHPGAELATASPAPEPDRDEDE